MKNNNNNNRIIFGSINVETGEIQNGYIDKHGQMKYRKEPWYKRIFRKRPEEIEYIGITQLYSQLIWSSKKNYFNAAVYRKFNPYTDQIYSIYANVDGRTIYFDVNAYVKNKVLI